MSAAPRREVPTFRDRVQAAGLPTFLLEDLADEAGPTELVDVLRTLPAAPRLLARAGHLVAVVGERGHAVATARRYAERLKIDPRSVLVAGRPVDDVGHAPDGAGDGTVIGSADQARRASAAVRVADLPAVVAVECAMGEAEAEWAVQLLRAISPDQVVACVDATRKVADTRTWLAQWARPGVHVDALSVVQAACTSDPATVLDLGLPVAEVDGLDATATTWLALLLERVQPRSLPRTRAPRPAATRPAAPAKAAPAKAAPAKAAPAKAAPAKAAPAKVAPTKAARTKTATKAAPAKVKATQPAATKAAPSKTAATKAASKPTSTKASPAAPPLSQEPARAEGAAPVPELLTTARAGTRAHPEGGPS